MWNARPEELKAYWTSRAVAVRAEAAVGSLARFKGRTGRVRTVNMNGRALVEFDGADETWFDLDPAALEPVAETPAAPPPVRPAVGEEPKGTPEPSALAKPAARMRPETPASPGGGKKLSVLELARQQDAAKKDAPAEAAAPTAPAAKPETGKKPSVLELARRQGAPKTGATAEQQDATAESDASAEGKTEGKTEGKKLSVLELARQQGAAKG